MKGTAYTVVAGQVPVPFNVEVLGVLPDGIAPDVDFILVKTSGPVIKNTGGIAAGFSGSPFYIGDRLVGSVSYGFQAADQTVGGVTPAQPMLATLEYPGLFPLPAVPARTVQLTAELERRAARAAGATVAAFPSTARQLPLPLGVSGLNGRGMDKLTERLARTSLSFVPYRSGSAAAVTLFDPTPLEPGAAIAAVLSYGDFSVAAVGTMTVQARCGVQNRLLAFGHPFFFHGATTLGLNTADVLTVVRDPSSLFGPFKIANITGGRGIVDQDRLTAIRGVEGLFPRLVPVTSLVRNPDLGTSRAGETRVAREDFLAPAAIFHLLGNLDRVFDRIGDGTVTLRSTIEGLRADGRSFTLNRRNMFYSPFDASFESIFELESMIAAIAANEFERVRFTKVDLDSAITQVRRTATITRVLSASSLQPILSERGTLNVQPGDTIRLRVFLRPATGTTERAVDLTRSVPTTAVDDGELIVRGGQPLFPEDLQPRSLDDLLAKLARAERNFDLVADLGMGTARRKTISAQPDVVLGTKAIVIVVR